MISIYDYLNLLTDFSAVRVRVFDCNTEEIVYDSDENHDIHILDSLEEANLADLEVGSVDLYRDNRQICLEFNVEVDEDDD